MLTSDYESHSLVIQEALEFKKLIVSTDTIGANFLLKGGQYGFLTEFTPDDIYLKIKTLLLNDDIKENLLKNLSERREDFSLCSFNNELQNLFNNT